MNPKQSAMYSNELGTHIDLKIKRLWNFHENAFINERNWKNFKWKPNQIKLKNKT